MAPQPFRINIAQEVLDDLQQRLVRTRWTDWKRLTTRIAFAG